VIEPPIPFVGIEKTLVISSAAVQRG
jgi:hypothetical protein